MGQPVRFGGTSWWRVSPPNLFVYALVIGPGHRLHLLAVTAPERRSHLVGDGSRRSKSSVGPAREPEPEHARPGNGQRPTQAKEDLFTIY